MTRPFEFNSGSLALDLVDTVSGRDGQPVELLQGRADLQRWLAGAGLAGAELAEIVTGGSSDDLAAIQDLRDAIYAATAALLEGSPPSGAAMRTINLAARAPDPRPQFDGERIAFHAEKGFEAILSRIAADAIQNFAPDVFPRLRRCPECRMLFRDNSKPGRRKWCSSSSGCGNRAKVRRHRARHAGEGQAGEKR